MRVGPLYRSSPQGGAGGRDYLNTAVVGGCRLRPDDLLAELKRVELRMGRRRGPRNAPRALDLDLLLYGDAQIDRPELTLPHPRLESRAFALAPLVALAPDWPVPPTGATVATLLARHRETGELEEIEWPSLLSDDC